MDWLIWRLVLSDKISASLREIEAEWTLADVMDAHAALDVQDDLQAAIDLRLNPPRAMVNGAR